MEEAEKELERRSKFLSSLILNKKSIEQCESLKVHVRACDMPLPLQNRAFHCARLHLESLPPGNKLDSKLLALALKKILILGVGIRSIGLTSMECV
ncbi:unnamed protein product [Sphenostylis stenocarpa]|uniref:Dynein light chain n=1 Tax=Sphenostylis stenocarpa TaxID=92480 RepID=A0AA86SXG1_9FABA|nr:unnamed protein product [Sphenostylis stenocarpa]